MDRRRVLIIDDDRDLLQGLSIRLRAHGYDVIHAADGVQAIGAARKTPPDVILLDLGLPGGDGYLVMERFRSMGAMSAVPIIVLSARDPATDRHRALGAGAEAFFHKPVDNAILLGAIRQALGESLDAEANR